MECPTTPNLHVVGVSFPPEALGCRKCCRIGSICRCQKALQKVISFRHTVTHVSNRFLTRVIVKMIHAMPMDSLDIIEVPEKVVVADCSDTMWKLTDLFVHDVMQIGGNVLFLILTGTTRAWQQIEMHVLSPSSARRESSLYRNLWWFNVRMEKLHVTNREPGKILSKLERLNLKSQRRNKTEWDAQLRRFQSRGAVRQKHPFCSWLHVSNLKLRFTMMLLI